jgi:putative inorganic carbon (HCO3(-)) transporter
MEGVVLFALALAGFVGVLRRPEWGAPYFALLLFTRFSDVLRTEFGLPSLFMVLAPALLVAAVGRWLVTGEEPGAGWRTATALMLAYGAVCMGSLLYASEGDRTLDALLNYADGVVIVWGLTLYLRNLRDLRRTLDAILVGGTVLAALAVWQQLTGSVEATYAGFSSVELRNIHDDTAGFRSEGPVSANYFALVLVVLVPLAMDRLLHAARPRLRVLAGLALGVILVALVGTYSRGAIVALGVVCLAMLVWVPRRRVFQAVAVAAAPILLAFVFLIPSDYVDRLSALGQLADVARGELPADNALRGRLSEVTAAAMMLRDHSLIGVGYGNFEIHYPRYARELALDGRREERQAHSLYLEVGAETGLIGLVAFGGMLLVPALGLRRARDRALRAGDREAGHLLTTFAIACLGYLVGSLFLHLTYPRYFWLLLGIAFATSALGRAEAPATARAPVHGRLATEGR